jgi:hypothetical protein
MIRFDLERALAGDTVITRDGIEVTQLVEFTFNNETTLYGVHEESGSLENWCINGSYNDPNYESIADLFMAPKKLSGFVNIYDDKEASIHVHNSKNSANEYARKVYRQIGYKRVACIDLSQHEEGAGL